MNTNFSPPREALGSAKARVFFVDTGKGGVKTSISILAPGKAWFDGIDGTDADLKLEEETLRVRIPSGKG